MNQIYLTVYYFLLVSFGFLLNYSKFNLDRFYSFFYIFNIFVLGVVILPNIDMLSRDFLNYYNWFMKIEKEGVSGFWDLKDPIFQYIVLFIQNVFGNSYFAIYMFFFICISYCKLFFSKLMGLGSLYLILLWLLFGQTFILYELTQIRAGFAISLCSYFIARDIQKLDKINLLFMLLSCFIHQSVFVLFLSYLLLRLSDNLFLSRNFTIFIYIMGLVSGLFLKPIFSNVVGLYFIGSERAKDYLDNSYSEIFEVSFLSVFYIAQSFVILFLSYFYLRLNDLQKKILFLSTLGSFFYSVFSFNSVLAYRFSEVFIFFTLVCMVFLLQLRVININFRQIWFLILVALGVVFSYSSSKIILVN